MDFNKFFHFDSDDPESGFYFREATAKEDADLVLVSAPWDMTSQKGNGAMYTPDAIIDESSITSTYDIVSGVSLKGHVATAEIDYDIQESAQQLCSDVMRIFSHASGDGNLTGDYFTRKISRINASFDEMHGKIYGQVKDLLASGKKIGIIGGDHSVTYGAVKAVMEHDSDVGILFLDAHCDFADHADIFSYTHNTIAKNILDDMSDLHKMHMVGIREASESDMEIISGDSRLQLTAMEEIHARISQGETWSSICSEIAGSLPEKLYVSIDADVLETMLCPHTDHPVAGGMQFDALIELIRKIVDSGHQIIGFDITEIVPATENSIDIAVGARLLSKMCCLTIKNQCPK